MVWVWLSIAVVLLVTDDTNWVSLVLEEISCFLTWLWLRIMNSPAQLIRD